MEFFPQLRHLLCHSCDDTKCRTSPCNQIVICENPSVCEGKRAAKFVRPGAHLQPMTNLPNMQEIDRKIDGQSRDILHLKDAAQTHGIVSQC